MPVPRGVFRVDQAGSFQIKQFKCPEISSSDTVFAGGQVNNWQIPKLVGLVIPNPPFNPASVFTQYPSPLYAHTENRNTFGGGIVSLAIQAPRDL